MSERKPEPTGEFLDPKAFGKLLDLHRESVYRGIARGELVAIRVGKALRLPKSQIEDLFVGDDANEVQ